MSKNTSAITTQHASDVYLIKDTKGGMSHKLISTPENAAAMVIGKIYENVAFNNHEPGVDAVAIAAAIDEQRRLLVKGDTSSLEEMLLSQIHVLNAISTKMNMNACGEKSMKKFEVFSNIALRAQNQTRQTIATLADIKGVTKSTVVNQINQGEHQQINTQINASSNDRVKSNDLD